MKISKLMLGAVAAMVLGAAGIGAWQFLAAREVAEAGAVTKRRSEDLSVRIASLEQKLATEIKRADAVESDNATLAGAVKTAQVALAKPAAVAITREGFSERLKNAVLLAKEGDPETARRELLWCLDVATAQPGLLAGGQMISIMDALMRLSERHPVILADLRERFEAGKRRVLAGDDREPLVILGTIARALKDDQAMVSVFDAFPARSPARTFAGLLAVEGLVVARRYEDVLAVQSYGMMSSAFERITAGWLDGLASAKFPERAKAAGRSYAVTTAARNIEVLAGAGDLEHARELAGRLLAFDGSEATRALLQKHLARAGRAGLLSGP
jgi:hypothetical protein